MGTQSKAEILADLKQRIITMELAPGDHLDETQLSQHYGISRTPFRDMCRILAGEGYLEIREKRGTYVSPMTHTTLRDFFQTAPVIYALVGRLAARHHTARQLESLEKCQAAFREAMQGGAVQDMVTGNDRFHAIIGEMCANAYLLPSYRRLLVDHARIGQTFWRGGAGQHEVQLACQHHDAFIQHIAAHDEQAVVDLTMQHWELSQRHMEAFVRPAPLVADREV